MLIHHKIVVLIASVAVVMASVSYATQIANAQNTDTVVVEDTQKDAVVQDKSFIMYHSETCPHCKEQMKLMPSLQEMYPDVSFEMREVSKDKANQELFKEDMKQHNKVANGVPTSVINDSIVLEGYDKNRVLATMINTFGRPIKASEGVILPSDDEVKDILAGIEKKQKDSNDAGKTDTNTKKYIAITALVVAFGIGIISLFK